MDTPTFIIDRDTLGMILDTEEIAALDSVQSALDTIADAVRTRCSDLDIAADVETDARSTGRSDDSGEYPGLFDHVLILGVDRLRAEILA